LSKINVKRVVDNMSRDISIYTPVVEMIVNAVQAIEETGRADGHVHVRVIRGLQPELETGLQPVIGFEFEDNGVGFTDAHRDSFDTLYTGLKIVQGGKGFGRFTALKYFDEVQIRSVYASGDAFRCRTFSMGKGNEIIVSEKDEPSDKEDSGTVVTLSRLITRSEFEKTLVPIAKNIVEKLLPYFFATDHSCPEVTISEMDGSDPIRLNDFVSNELSASFREIELDCHSFTLGQQEAEEEFLVRLFKVYSPGNQKSRVSLVAHKREASHVSLDRHVPEFVDEFYDREGEGENESTRNFVVKIYVSAEYLDKNVSLERDGFQFPKESGMFDIGQLQIEQTAAAIARDAMGTEINSRREKKRQRVQEFVDEKPWHRSIASDLDLSDLPYRPSDDEIDAFLHTEKFKQETAIRRDAKTILEHNSLRDRQLKVAELAEKISESSKDELIHYVALRRLILDLLEKSLEIDESGAHSPEGLVHDIIFPRKGDSDSTDFEHHNLWMIDERLSFATFVASDQALKGGVSDRPDILAFGNRVSFREGNEASNPITIVEFKRPQRDDFVNLTGKDDPVQQVIRYVNALREGDYKTPKGRQVLVAENTPFYGYIVLDITSKTEKWLRDERNFTPMPDRLGWFCWFNNINLYMEVLSWDKLHRDAERRNKFFFYKLGI
jgi:hypothetical protein